MLRRFLLLTFVFFIVAAALPAVGAQADCDFSFSNYARAVQLHDMGDYDRALQHYHCALQEDPDDAVIPLLIANVHKDIANAASAWSRDRDAAIAAACDPAQDHALLGAEAHVAGDDNLALIHLHCVLLGDPTHVDALYLTGTIYFSRGETRDGKYYVDRADRAAEAARAEAEDLLVYLLGDDARSVLNGGDLPSLSLTSPDPGETGEYLRPGERYQRTYLIVIWTREGNDHAKSAETDLDIINELEWFLAQDPTRADLRCELGRLHKGRGEYAAAYSHFTYLIAEALGNYCSGADHDTAAKTAAPPAIAKLERALEQDPTRVDLRCQLGQLYYARGDYAAAYVHFSYLIRDELGDYCGSEESSDAGPMTTATAIEIPARVSPAEGAFEDGLRYMSEGKLYLAANIFLHALDLDPLHLDARCRLGMIYSEWANYRGALDQFDFVLQRNPQDSCARQNRTIAARDMLAIFTPLVVDDYFHYARTYIRMEEWELARDAFLKGLEIDPTRYDVRCELGMIYVQLGDDRAALDQFDLALFADEMDSCARSNRYALLQRLRDQ